MNVKIEGSVSVAELQQLVADKIARDNGVTGMAKGQIVFTIINNQLVNAYASLDVEMPDTRKASDATVAA